MTTQQLPDDVLEALRAGHTIEAVKRLRAATGIDLKQAKDLLERHGAGETVSAIATAVSGALPPEVVAALKRGNKIEAIRLLRQSQGGDLKSARQTVEAAPGHVRSANGMGVTRGDSRYGSAFWVVALALAAVLLVVFRSGG